MRFTDQPTGPRTTRAQPPVGHLGALLGVLVITLVLPAAPVRADEITFEYFRGTSFSAPMTLTVDQIGQAPIAFKGHYSTRPLQDSPYYVYRFSRWKDTTGWVVEFTHHKAYLDNPQQGVDAFEVTHGYNLITANRSWHFRYLSVMAGGGLVVTFPHSTIRGQIGRAHV